MREVGWGKCKTYLKRSLIAVLAAALCALAIHAAYRQIFQPEKGELLRFRTLDTEDLTYIDVVSDSSIVSDPEAMEEICLRIRSFRYKASAGTYPAGKELHLQFEYADFRNRKYSKEVWISEDMSATCVDGTWYIGEPGYFRRVLELIKEHLRPTPE